VPNFEPVITGCDDGNQCTASNFCDSFGSCTLGVPLTGQNCGDGGTQCTNQDTCFEGACQDKGFKDEGTACGDPDDTVCNNPDTCNGGGTCNDNLKPEGTVCRASVGVCDVAEICTGSSADCPGNIFQPQGTICSCSAGEGFCDGIAGQCIKIEIDIKPQCHRLQFPFVEFYSGLPSR